MARHFKIDDLLSEPERAEYSALLRSPATTVDAAMAWLEERGFKVSRTAVWAHKRNFDEVLKGVRQSAELAASFAQVARDSGVAGLSEASLGRFQQLLMEKLFSMEADDGLEAGELMKLSVALKTAVSARQQIEDLKTKYDQVMRSTTAGRKEISAADLVEARKQIFGS